MSTNRSDRLERWVPDWMLLPAQTHHDLLEHKLSRIGVTMTAYGLFKGFAETLFVALCIYGVSQGAPPGLAIIAAAAVVLGWETFEKALLLRNVDEEILEQLQTQTDGGTNDAEED